MILKTKILVCGNCAPDCNGNPTASVGKGMARGIAVESRKCAPEKKIKKPQIPKNKWLWRISGSNRPPLDCQSNALAR